MHSSLNHARTKVATIVIIIIIIIIASFCISIFSYSIIELIETDSLSSQLFPDAEMWKA
jgi:archaellum component FlaG (FlaF/FlaG flagellin family)